MLKAGRYDIELKKYADFSIVFQFPYEIGTYTFYAYLLNSKGEQILSFDVANDNTNRKVTIRLTRNQISLLSSGMYRWTFLQKDAANYQVELIYGNCEVK